MSNETLLVIVLLILIVGSIPSWPYSKSWGYVPIGALSLILAVFIVLSIADHRPLFRSSPRSEISGTVHEVGHDIKEAGRETADSIRRAVE